MDINTNRTLHLIDVENLLMNSRPTATDVRRCSEAYGELGLVGPSDLTVVACNPAIGLDVGLGWDGARLLVRHGPSGADLSLAQVAVSEQVERRFGHVVVASGDGLFVDAVAYLQLRGVRVTVVATPRGLSKRLRLAANQVVPFGMDSGPSTPAIATRAA